MAEIKLNLAALGLVDPLPVLNADGIEFGAEPYLLSDGKSLMAPTPAILVDGPVLIAGKLYGPVSFGGVALGPQAPIVVGTLAYARTWAIGSHGEVVAYPPDPEPAIVMGAAAYGAAWSIIGGTVNAHPAAPRQIPDVSAAGAITGVSYA